MRKACAGHETTRARWTATKHSADSMHGGQKLLVRWMPGQYAGTVPPARKSTLFFLAASIFMSRFVWSWLCHHCNFWCINKRKLMSDCVFSVLHIHCRTSSSGSFPIKRALTWSPGAADKRKKSVKTPLAWKRYIYLWTPTLLLSFCKYYNTQAEPNKAPQQSAYLAVRLIATNWHMAYEFTDTTSF